MILNIAPNVRQNFAHDKHLLSVVAAFSKHFRTNYGRTEYDPTLGNYGILYLRPERELELEFSLTREVLCLAFDPQAKFDSRAFVLIDEILAKEATRLVDDSVFIITDVPNAQALCDEYMESRHRKVILCAWPDIEAAHEDFSKELLRQFFYSRDFFDVTDPVSTDAQFFARYKLVDDVSDTLLTGQSVGIFGLRKIGKTSVLDRIIKKINSRTALESPSWTHKAPKSMQITPPASRSKFVERLMQRGAALTGRPL